MKAKVLILATFMFASVVVFAADKKEKFKVKASEACEQEIEKAAKNVDGVTQAKWDKESKNLEVSFDDAKTDANQIEMAVAQAGFDTQNHEAPDEAYNNLPDDCKTRGKSQGDSPDRSPGQMTPGQTPPGQTPPGETPPEQTPPGPGH